MNPRLEIVWKGSINQNLVFEYLPNQDYVIFFNGSETVSRTTASLNKKELAKHRLLWGHLCKLADHLKEMPVNFISEDGTSPQTSMLVSRFEDRITIDFFSISKGNPPTKFWALMVCARDGNLRNMRALPPNIDAEMYHFELCHILRDIVSLGHKIKIDA